MKLNRDILNLIIYCYNTQFPMNSFFLPSFSKVLWINIRLIPLPLSIFNSYTTANFLIHKGLSTLSMEFDIINKDNKYEIRRGRGDLSFETATILYLVDDYVTHKGKHEKACIKFLSIAKSFKETHTRF